jgi:hypothetical protein
LKIADHNSNIKHYVSTTYRLKKVDLLDPNV